MPNREFAVLMLFCTGTATLLKYTAVKSICLRLGFVLTDLLCCSVPSIPGIYELYSNLFVWNKHSGSYIILTS